MKKLGWSLLVVPVLLCGTAFVETVMVQSVPMRIAGTKVGETPSVNHNLERGRLSESVGWQDYCHAVVSSVTALHPNAQVPQHFRRGTATKTGEDFDVNKYFNVLKHISPPEGQILDYVYWYAGGNGRPLLYLRDRMRPPWRTFEEYEQKGRRGKEEDLPTLLRLDGTPESFFELVVYKVLAGQFYLSWHANYNDTQIMTLRSDVENVLKHIRVSYPQYMRALSIEVTPSVKFLDQDAVSVSVVLFSKWGGFFRVTEKIARSHPHRFLATETQDLVKYDCGIKF